MLLKKSQFLSSYKYCFCSSIRQAEWAFFYPPPDEVGAGLWRQMFGSPPRGGGGCQIAQTNHLESVYVPFEVYEI